MESTLKHDKRSRVRILVTVTEEEVSSHEAAALEDLRLHAKIPGFRPGKAPEAKLREHFGEQGIRARVIERALPGLYADAVKRHELRPVSRPETSITKIAPLTVEFAVDIYPEVKVSKPEKIKLTRKEVLVDEKEFDTVMQDLQNRFRSFTPVERAAATGDRVEISFTGLLDGVPDPRLSSQHHPVIIGSKSFIEGFEVQLVGVSAGDMRDITVTFPADYRATDLRGKTAVFQVTVETVEQVELPVLDDALAVRATGRPDATIAALRNDVREGMLREKQAEEDDRLERELLDGLVSRTSVDLPASLVDEEVSFFLADLQKRVEGQGLKFEHYLEIQRKTPEQLAEQFRPEAEKRLTARLALVQIAEDRKVEVTDDELKSALATVEDTARARDPHFADQLRHQLRLSKTVTELRDAALGKKG